MKPLQGQNSDLLAMLSGKAGGAKNAGKTAGEGVDLLSMLNGSTKASGLSKSEFAEILSQKGMLEDISAEDLLNFFKKSQGESGEAVSQLLQHYSELTGKSIDLDALPKEVAELSFNGSEFKKPNGEVVPKSKVLKLLSQIEGKQSQSANSFPTELKSMKGAQTPQVAEMPQGKKIDKKAMLGKSNASDFVDQKMAVAKNSARTQNVQAMKNNPAVNQYGQEKKKLSQSLIQPKRVSGLENISTPKSHKLASKDSLQDMMQEVTDSNSFDAMAVGDLNSRESGAKEFQMNKGQGTQTLDLSNISANNKTELLQKVGNYIEQSYVSGRDSVDMVINHEELGQFRVQAQKAGTNGQVNLEINTLTEKGHQFFAENEVELLKTLNKSGIKLNDFKIAPQSDFLSMGDASKSSMNSDSSSSSFGGGDRGEASAFTQGGRQGDNRGEDRRRQLWQEAKTFSEQMYA